MKKELIKKEELVLAYAFSAGSFLDEDLTYMMIYFGEGLSFVKNGEQRRAKDPKSEHKFQWWARPSDIKELNKLLKEKTGDW